MEDEICLADETAHHCFIEDRVVHELDVVASRGKVRNVPSREVVEHRDSITQADQSVNEVRADVSRTSGHQRAHAVKTLLVACRTMPEPCRRVANSLGL